MSTQQAAPQQATPEAVTQTESIFDDIIENTTARQQAEAAKADSLTATAYAKNVNAYAIAMGRDMGLNAATALQLIHVIGGKPSLSAGARALFLKKAGYDWKPVRHDDKACVLRFWRNGEPMTDVEGKPLDVSFTFEDAERAQFVQNSRGSGKMGNYDKFPKNMLFARCISNFHRWYAPEVIGAGLYDVGEVNLDDVVAATEQRIAEKTNSNVERLKQRLAEFVETSAEVAQ